MRRPGGTTNTDAWETPADLFARLNAEFDFTLDVCAKAHNKKCDAYYSESDDGLSRRWCGRCWMNPPYGREIGKWVAKAHQSVREGAELVVCLLPARTDTAWWHDHVLRAAEVRFIRGRLKFGGLKASAPFPSALVVFRPSNTEQAPVMVA